MPLVTLDGDAHFDWQNEPLEYITPEVRICSASPSTTELLSERLLPDLCNWKPNGMVS